MAPDPVSHTLDLRRSVGLIGRPHTYAGSMQAGGALTLEDGAEIAIRRVDGSDDGLGIGVGRYFVANDDPASADAALARA